MTRPWPCKGCGSALGLLTDGGSVELDKLMSQVILTQRGAVVICEGCHHRKRWEVSMTFSLEVAATSMG